MKRNASYRHELTLLGEKNEESERQNNLLAQQRHELCEQLKGTLRSNQRLQKQINGLSRENQKLLEDSHQSLDAHSGELRQKDTDVSELRDSLDAHSRELRQKDTDVSELRESLDAHFRKLKQKDKDVSELRDCVRAQKDKLTRLATSARNQTSAYHSVQGQLATLEVKSSERIRWLETCLALNKMDYRMLEDRAHAAKTKYDTRLQKLRDFVLVEQEIVQRTADELQEFEEAVSIEIAESDASKYSLIFPVRPFALY